MHSAIDGAEEQVVKIQNVLRQIRDNGSSAEIPNLKASLLSLVGTHLYVVQHLSDSNTLDADVASHFPIHYQKISALKQPATKSILGDVADAVFLGLESFYQKGKAYLDTLFKERVETSLNRLTGNLTTIEEDTGALLEGLSDIDRKHVERIQEAICESARNKTSQIERFSLEMEQCLKNHSCTTTTPRPTAYVHGAMHDLQLAALEKKLGETTKQTLASIHADVTKCSLDTLDRGTTAVEDLERMVAVVAARWGIDTSNAYKDSLPWELLSSMQPCEHPACVSDYNSSKLEAFKRLTSNSSAHKAKEYHSNLARKQRQVLDLFKRASSLNPSAVKALQDLGMDTALDSCECTDKLVNLAQGLYAELEGAARRGDAIDAFDALLQNSPPSLSLPAEAPSWFTPAYKKLVACANANVDVDRDDALLSIAHCRTQVESMDQNTANSTELRELDPYAIVVDELPLRKWCASMQEAKETNDLTLYIEGLRHVPPITSESRARRVVIDLVAASKATAWQHVPARLTAEAVGALKADAAVDMPDALKHIQRDYLLPLNSVINTYDTADDTADQTLAKERFASVQKVVEEALCELQLNSMNIKNTVDSTHIRSTIVVSPKEAKYGGVAVHPCSKENRAAITIPANLIAERSPNKTLELPRRGLPSLSGKTRGDRTIVVTVDGYTEASHVPEGSFELAPTLNCVHRQASDEVPDALGELHCYERGTDIGSGTLLDYQHHTPSHRHDQPDRQHAEQQPPSKETKIAAYSTLLNGIRAFQPLAQLKAIFCDSMTADCSDDAAFTKAYNSAKRPSMARGEFRSEDKGGCPLKAAFALNLVPTILGTTSVPPNEVYKRRIYDGLAARLIPKWRQWNPQTRTTLPPAQADESDDPTHEVERMIKIFDEALPTYRNDADFAVPPRTKKTERHRADFDGTGSHRQSHVKLVPGGGEPNRDYPWRGDLTIDITVDNVLDGTINDRACTLEKMTVPWDLKVSYALSSYDVYSGSVKIVLQHPDGNSYHMLVDAPCGGSADGEIFMGGKHVYQISNLGNPKGGGSQKRGDLYLVLVSNVEEER